MSQASIQLSSGVPVMALGGFGGSDPAPTLAQFQEYVATGQVRYFVEGGGPGGGGLPGDRGGDRSSRGTTGEITTWVTTYFAKLDVGGRTVYDLGRPLA